MQSHLLLTSSFLHYSWNPKQTIRSKWRSQKVGSVPYYIINHEGWLHHSEYLNGALFFESVLSSCNPKSWVWALREVEVLGKYLTNPHEECILLLTSPEGWMYTRNTFILKWSISYQVLWMVSADHPWIYLHEQVSAGHASHKSSSTLDKCPQMLSWSITRGFKVHLNIQVLNWLDAALITL